MGKERRIMPPNLESSEDVTELLLNWQSGDDEDAPAKLMPLVYEELRRVARRYLQQAEQALAQYCRELAKSTDQPKTGR